MLLSFIVLIALCAISNADVGCPRDEYLIPFGCRCRSEGRVQCTGVENAKTFEMIMAACNGYELLEFTLVKAKLDWLPPNTFESINTIEFVLSKSALKSLTPPGAGNRLFKDSGIENFIIDGTDIHDGDLSQIGDLKDLRQLVIRDYPNNVDLEYLMNQIQSKDLKELVLENLPHLIRKGHEISQLNNLKTLSLSGLDLRKISREDLPENVGLLENLWLKDNTLESLPEHFLDGMRNLKMLDLSSNAFQTLDEETFAPYDQFIVLHGNPFICDWRLDWLRDRLLRNSLKIMTPQPITCEDGSDLINGNFKAEDSYQLKR